MFEAADSDASPVKTRVGAGVLDDQVRIHISALRDQVLNNSSEATTAELVGIAKSSLEADVLLLVVRSLGADYNPWSVPFLLANCQHSSSEIRKEVAATLSVVLGGDLLREDHPVVAALIALMKDPEVETRGWATFALGNVITDGEKVRSAFLAAEAIRDIRKAQMARKESG